MVTEDTGVLERSLLLKDLRHSMREVGPSCPSFQPDMS